MLCLSTLHKTFSLDPDFQKEVLELIKGQIPVGHVIHHDLKITCIPQVCALPSTCMIILSLANHVDSSQTVLQYHRSIYM